MGWVWTAVWFVSFITLFYHRASKAVWTTAWVVLLLLWSKLSHASMVELTLGWLLFLIVFFPLYVVAFRQKFISQPLLRFYRNVMPTMSRTEREALAAGTVGWEGDLFSGSPNWNKLLSTPKPSLTQEEQRFIDGPVKILCSMIDDWKITHELADLPPEIWQFLKDEGFFGLIIPKEYGGKQFSAYAHSQVLIMVYGKSVTVATTIAVPNSLGPAELLLHYGTPEQKQYYLPNLASGKEVPCFALTGPDAGSDAGAMQDKGVVCWGEYQGKKVLGIRLNFNKRYITLAPVATVIGLAFKLYDPEQLLGNQVNLGITCALIPRNTAGMDIGHRHFPVNIVFQNGPIHGKDVFIPVDWIIGGPNMAGQGWRMLMECLAAGRAISLPASCVGGAKIGAYTVGAYARVRRQFKTPIGYFEGIEEALARIGGYTYLADATRILTVSLIDTGHKPAVASAITKYHVTELGRMIAGDIMDVLGGKGICLGPHNLSGRFYESVPIAITVEGANILTRSMIIFGQGAMRCHPYIFAEFEAASNQNVQQGLLQFDKALFGHIAYTLSNVVRSLVLGFTSGRIVKTPPEKTKKYFQQATRFSAAFALIADISLLVMGGSLKRRESISARLGDILSYLYLMSAVLKHYHDQGKKEDDLPIVRWVSLTYLYQIQEKLTELLKNYPNRWISYLLKVCIFPLGRHFTKADDKLGRKVAKLLVAPTPSRQRLTEGAFVDRVPGNLPADYENALLLAIAVEPIEQILKTALHDKVIEGDTLIEQARVAFSKQLISKTQLDIVLQSEEARYKVISVDDFLSDELTHIPPKTNIYANPERTK